jgi:hypothetical protein
MLKGVDMRFSNFLIVGFLICLMLSTKALAQRPDGGSVEFAVLGGLTSLSYEDSWGYEDSESYLTIPSGSSSFPLSSMLRLGIWTDSPLVVELGFSFLNVNDGDDLTVSNIEGGIGAAFGEGSTKTFPFASILIGLLSVDGGGTGGTDTEGYIGFQGGMKYFFRKHAAIRMQVGYRNFLGDELNLKSSLEIAGGLSFFI